jgi:hypothetical protein
MNEDKDDYETWLLEANKTNPYFGYLVQLENYRAFKSILEKKIIADFKANLLSDAAVEAASIKFFMVGDLKYITENDKKCVQDAIKAALQKAEEMK